jgi:hypothetical protein
MKAKLNKSQVQKQLLETTGMMAEDINQFVPVQDLAGKFVSVPAEPVKKKRGRPSKKQAENITMEIKEVKKRGRPKKYATAEEARKAKIANTIAGAKRRKEAKAQGKGLFSGIKKAVKSVANTATNVANKVKDTASAVIYGRNDYPPKVRKIISQYGSKNITGITLGRTPLGTPLLTALQVASGNTFSQKLQNTPYDKLFHLFACIELDGSSKITIEKNEVINFDVGCKIPKDTETKNITSSDIPTGLSLIDALNKTQERMGGNYFTYSAKDNNCQDFIVAFLTANNIGDETDRSWVKQETKVLFEGNDRLRKIANTLTDIGARVDVLRQGAGIESDSDSDSSSSSSSSSSSGGSMNGGGMYDKLWENNPFYAFQKNNNNIEEDYYEKIKMRNQRGYGVVDFEDLKWGSFSKQLQQYNRTHKPKLDLHSFAMMILANPKKFNKRTIKRARFYVNVILKNGGMINEDDPSMNNEEDRSIINEDDPRFINPGIRIARRRRPPTPPPPPPPPPPPSPAEEDEENKENIPPPNPNIQGRGKKKSPVNNIGMANNWINYVKAYAKKHNIKYSEALKDPKCKAGYKKGEGLFDVLKSVGQAVAPVAIDLASDYAKKKVSGGGMPTSRDEYIAQLYEQANLGANGRVNLN